MIELSNAELTRMLKQLVEIVKSQQKRIELLEKTLLELGKVLADD